MRRRNDAARHPATRVRIAVCRMENLSAETVRLLADDPCAEVRRQLVSSKALVRHADTEMLFRLAASDPAVAEVLAEYLSEFKRCEVTRLEEVLAAHPDPSVKLALARNGEVSPSVLVQLHGDFDPSVAAEARRTLRSLQSPSDETEAFQHDGRARL